VEDPLAGTPYWWQSVARHSVRGPADVGLLVLDAALVVTAFALMLLLRYELDVPADVRPEFFQFVAVAVILQLVINRLSGLYGPVWQHASMHEAQRILLAGAIVTLTLSSWVLVFDRLVPLSVALTGGVVATGLLGVLRFQSRLFAFHRGREVDALRVLVVGAGRSGGAILREVERDDRAEFRVVAMVDDDTRKVGRWLGGVLIAGTIDQLVEVGRQHDVGQVLLAIPSADSELIRRVADATAELGVPLKVLPGATELMNGQPRLRDVRDLSIDDLLGRQPIDTDLRAVCQMVHGRRVLVTGGGGSIGSEVVRQIDAYEPARLVVLDRDETHLFDALAAIDGRGVPSLVDVRNRERLRRLFLEERPEIVFHAAANKHVPLLESSPVEAVETNVFGTANLVAAAREAQVERLVFISTDKAVRPSSVMGASKRLGEQIVLSGAPEGGAWCAVRFGNVLGSRGSVVPTFVRQIQRGGPVTITHPDMTRFFMSIPEAVQLVLQASALAERREVFMLDMGEPVRIVDLASRMISLAGYRIGVDVGVEVVGLRPGEKLAEELHTPEEEPATTSHAKIVRLRPNAPGTEAVQRSLDLLEQLIRDQAGNTLIRAALFTRPGEPLARSEPSGPSMVPTGGNGVRHGTPGVEPPVVARAVNGAHVPTGSGSVGRFRPATDASGQAR
jgi:FlaA1/EpsC-like NDP-sugar epimerase